MAAAGQVIARRYARAENEKSLAASEAQVEDKNESWDREQCGHIADRA
jgi:hypothetical protein